MNKWMCMDNSVRDYILEMEKLLRKTNWESKNFNYKLHKLIGNIKLNVSDSINKIVIYDHFVSFFADKKSRRYGQSKKLQLINSSFVNTLYQEFIGVDFLVKINELKSEGWKKDDVCFLERLGHLKKIKIFKIAHDESLKIIKTSINEGGMENICNVFHENSKILKERLKKYDSVGIDGFKQSLLMFLVSSLSVEFADHWSVGYKPVKLGVLLHEIVYDKRIKWCGRWVRKEDVLGDIAEYIEKNDKFGKIDTLFDIVNVNKKFKVALSCEDKVVDCAEKWIKKHINLMNKSNITNFYLNLLEIGYKGGNVSRLMVPLKIKVGNNNILSELLNKISRNIDMFIENDCNLLITVKNNIGRYKIGEVVNAYEWCEYMIECGKNIQYHKDMLGKMKNVYEKNHLVNICKVKAANINQVMTL